MSVNGVITKTGPACCTRDKKQRERKLGLAAIAQLARND